MVPCPVFPRVSLGDHTMGGRGPGIRDPDSYIYIYGFRIVYMYI